MIYDGQEVGCPIRLNFFNNSTIIDWTLNPDMLTTYKKIIGFRNGSETIRQGALTSYSSNDACVFTKSYNGDTVLVMVNLRNTVTNYTTPAAFLNTQWKNVFDGSSFTTGAQVTLQPYEYKILEE